MSTSSQPVICFGVFEADLRSGELRKNGAKIKIQELPFRALKLLLSRPHHVLTREEFRQALWPDGVFVDFDHGISSAINRSSAAGGKSGFPPGNRGKLLRNVSAHFQPRRPCLFPARFDAGVISHRGSNGSHRPPPAR